MKYETIKTYSFDELSEETKNKVIVAMQEGEDFYFLEDFLNDILEEKLKDNKIYWVENKPKLNYSLNYSQGDGLKFTGFFKWRHYYVFIKDGNLRNYYSHKYTTNICLETFKGNEVKPEIEKEFKEIFYKICDELEKIGYSYIEDALSEDSIKENIKANEYIFFHNGTIANNYF